MWMDEIAIPLAKGGQKMLSNKKQIVLVLFAMTMGGGGSMPKATLYQTPHRHQNS
jgi:hypothetical protein